MARTRVGVIGCGFFSSNHLNAWRDLADAELVAVCDTDMGKAQAAAQQFGVRAYDSAEAMLASERLGLVDIVTQVRSHRPLVELCLKAGVPTIVQKPFGLSLDDCVAMRDLSEQLGVPLAVHENFRFQAPMQFAKQILDSGEIGETNWARISFRTGFDIYGGQPYLRTEEKFVINDLGV
ncbi:MAG: Gfo/Idh/MocA family oxidoreductase, partial [Devosia sp.]